MYKVLIQKKDKGAPLGLSNCVLNDEFNPSIFNEDYGYKPWYNYKEQDNNNLKEEMFLICKLKYVDYEIRNLTKHYYSISNDLVMLLEKYNIRFSEKAKLNIVNIRGEIITNRDYRIVRFGKEIAKNPLEIMYEESFYIKNRRVKLKEIKIRPQVAYPIFKIKDIDEKISCFFFRDTLVKQIIDYTPFVGIDFIGINAYPWSKKTIAKYLEDLSETQHLLLIH